MVSQQKAAIQVGEVAKKQVRQTIAAAKIAKERVKGTKQVRIDAEMEMKKIKQQEFEDRTQAILELKANSDAAFAAMAGQNHKNSQRQEAKKRQQAKDFGDILAGGDNPYEVFRKREIDSKARKRREMQQTSKKAEEARIAENMIVEDERIRKEQTKKRREKGFDEQFQKEQGRAAVEGRVKSYLMGKTRDGVDMVDPTGRLMRVDPSQVTTIKDKTFGLGKSNRKDDTAEDRLRVIQQIAAKSSNRGVTADPRFVPKKKQPQESQREDNTGSAGNDAVLAADIDGAGLLLAEGAPPGADVSFQMVADEDLAVSTHDDQDQEPEKEVADPTAAESRDNNTGKSKAFGAPRLSVLEQKYMAQARERQRQNITQKQVVWGKEFTGRPFLCRPEQIQFKDFEVDRPERRRIVLTNVSYTFNTFKILSLPDDIKDFFEITYTKPGRMSAGMTCSIDITFHPKVNKDIITELPFLAGTGKFSVPLLCTTKKAVPSVSTQLITFENVVMGEHATFDLCVRNDGALQTDFELITDTDGLDEPSPTSSDAASNNPSMAITAATNEEELMTLAEGVAAAAEGGGNGKKAISHPEKGCIAPYSQQTLKIVFSPHTPTSISVPLIMKFSDPNVSDLSLTVKANALRVPIYVEHPILDFRCCVYQKLYRARLVLRNRGAVALKMLAQVPPELAGSMEFNPSLGFVQGRQMHPHTHETEDGRFEVQIKFRPSPGLLGLCGRHALPTDGSAGSESSEAPGIIAVPIQVHVPNQILPVYFILRAQLTTSDIALSLDTMNFLSCYTTQATSIPLTMTNMSALPQKFGFVKLPAEVSVEPNDGFGILLPHESITRDVIFAPKSAVEYSFNLVLRTTLNREFKIPCKGTGILPPVKLSNTVIEFGATFPDDKVDQSIFLTNTSKVSQTFEFAIPYPAQSQLKVSPLVHTIAPGKTTRVQVEFCPGALASAGTSATGGAAARERARDSDNSKDEQDSKADADDAGDAGDAGAEAGKNDSPGSIEADDAAADDPEGGEEQGDGEAKIKEVEAIDDAMEKEVDDAILPELGRRELSDTAGRAAIPCGPNGEAGPGAIPPERLSKHAVWKLPCYVRPSTKINSGSTGEVASYPLLFAEVRTTVIQRQLIVDQQRIDFGQLAVDKVKVVLLRVRNPTDIETPLQMQGLNPCGSYSIVNALRPIAPNSYRDLQVKFQPTEQLHYCETLCLLSNTGKATVALVGQGVSPTLSVEPESGVLDLGHIISGESSTAQFKLHNSSVFPLDYCIRPRNATPLETSQHNFSNIAPFMCMPAEGTIQPNGSIDIEVTFSADHERPHPYQTEFIIDVPNQKQVHTMLCKGRCWDRQGFVMPELIADCLPPDALETIECALKLPTSLQKNAESSANSLIKLEFPKPSSKPLEPKNVVIGSATTGAGKSGTVSFELEFEEQESYFTASPMKGSVNGPEGQLVAFTFEPPERDPSSANSSVIDLDAGQWVETKVICVLKGGFVPENADPETRISIVLRGYVSI